jgi:hypothetical protein
MTATYKNDIMINNTADRTSGIIWMPVVDGYQDLPVIEDDGFTYAAFDMVRSTGYVSYCFISEKGIWSETSIQVCHMEGHVERTPYAWVYEVQEHPFNEQDFHECMSFIKPDDVWWVRNIRPLYL